MSFNTIPKEEFADWLTPREVLNRLPTHLKSAAKKAALGHRLQDGLIRAAAGVVPGSSKSNERWEIKREVWADWDYFAEEPAFWDRGEYQMRTATDYVYETRTGKRVYDVRLDPQGVEKLVATVSARPPPAATVGTAGPRDLEPATDDGDSITADEYRRWLSVTAVVKLFAEDKLSIGLFGPRLMKRLLDAEVIAVGETYTLRRGQDKTVFLHRVIPTGLWARAIPDNAFWRMNEIDIRIPSNSRSPDTFYTLRGVKFRPRDIWRMLDREEAADLMLVSAVPAAHEAPELLVSVAASNGPKISPKVLLDWARQFGERNRDAVFRVFLLNARSAFPDKWISEKRMKDAIAELRLTKSRGNPTIRQK